MRKKSTAYTRHQASLRAARKRQADRDLKAPSMPQITTAMGFVARAMVAEARAKGRVRQLQPFLDATIARLRDAGFSVGEVTLSRIDDATAPKAPVTPSE